MPRIDHKKGYSYHVSNQLKVSGCSENHRHFYHVYILYVTKLETENHLEYCLKKLSNYLAVSVENSEKRENACLQRAYLFPLFYTILLQIITIGD